MAIVPQLALPIVSASAAVYDRNMERCPRVSVMPHQHRSETHLT
jgi:hypothetical protein